MMNMSGENDGCLFFCRLLLTLAITLFSQSTERAGTHADAWKQDVSPCDAGGVGAQWT